MSESTAREARRDLRRTVGASALETLRGQEQSIASVAASVNSLRNDVVQLAREHTDFKLTTAKGFRGHYDYTSQVAKDFLTFRHRTFWGRLRWLLTGR